MATTIDRIVGGGLLTSEIGHEGEAYQQALSSQVEGMKNAGVTHVVVNRALVSIPWVMDPENSYLRFTTYGPPPDQYVTSTYNIGLYHESLLAENRKILLRNAALARQNGFRCAIMCVEPTLMPESFYRRHPALRGPRVDNPTASTTPQYALCPTLPEVQDHYRQLIHKMLELVPEIDELQIFTNDSGGGVCYSTHLYSGPNGPVHCKEISPGKQAQIFAKTLIDAGREINPDFRVVLTSGLSPAEKADYAIDMPTGAASSVYGAFAWGAGLEDRWGTMNIGPKIYNNPEERAKVRAWQDADYKARVDQIKNNGGIVYASYSPYYYAGDDPRPFETHEVICKLISWGVSSLLGSPSSSEYSTNSAVMKHAIAHGCQPTEQVVRELTDKWVGPELAPKVLEIFRLNELVAREAPMPQIGHVLPFDPLVTRMPIVPDEELLGEHDLDYFLTPVLKDEQKMKTNHGGVWRRLNFGTENKIAYLKQLDDLAIPNIDKAIAMLDELLARTDLSEEQRSFLAYQREMMLDFPIYYRHLKNWLIASLHRIKGDSAPAGLPSLQDAIEAEIALYESRSSDASIAARIELMRAHKNDAARAVDLSEFELTDHIGTAGYEGAHEIVAQS